MGLPDFLRKKIPKRENILKIRRLISDQHVHTVCEEASCPNIGECFSQATCTFMILGKICTRSCAFCGVTSGRPGPIDPDEPARVAAAVNKLNLSYAVITSVTRDDLPDGGASQFAKVINELREANNGLGIETLIPDFQGNESALKIVLEAGPYVLNHNIETVPRLYPLIRPQADYHLSLDLLRSAKRIKSDIYTKSGFMVGLGETEEEVVTTLNDLKETGCDIVTIGQYLPPSRLHLKPERYVPPETFDCWQALGRQMGFLRVEAGPFVRSSYHAGDLVKK